MSARSPFASFLFDPLRVWLEQLPAQPDTTAVAGLAERFPVYTGNGQRIRFVPPQADGRIYECRIDECGEVETRPDNWHDFFNALVWLSFPQTKQAISAAHVHAMQAPGALRGRIRDALTHFDECGVLVLSSRPELLELIRCFRWKELFVEHREAVCQAMRFVIFGHATYEQLLAPFRGLTAKAVLHQVDPAWLDLDAKALSRAADGLLSADVKAGRFVRPRDLQPLPLLGIPGVVPDSANPDYYDDTWQFRPGRRTSQAGQGGAGS